MRVTRYLCAIALVAIGLVALPATASAGGGFVADAESAEITGSGKTWMTQTYTNFRRGAKLNTGCTPDVQSSIKGPQAYLDATSAASQPTCFAESQWELKGCHLTFHPAAGTVDIGPAGCGPTRLLVKTSCSPDYIEVGPQTGLKATYTTFEDPENSEWTKTVKVSLVSKNIPYTFNECEKKQSGNDLTLEATWYLKAYHNGTRVDLEYAKEVPIGFGVGGEKPGVFGGLYYPVEVSAEDTPGGSITLLSVPKGKATVTCQNADLGGGTLTEAVATLKLAGSFTSCSAEGIGTAATISMRSCSYELLEAEPVSKETGNPYVSKSAITCTTPGDYIQLALGVGCTIKVPAQTLSGTTDLENQVTPPATTLAAGIGASKVKYTTNFSCTVAGIPSAEDGTVDLDLLLSGALAN